MCGDSNPARNNDVGVIDVGYLYLLHGCCRLMNGTGKPSRSVVVQLLNFESVSGIGIGVWPCKRVTIEQTKPTTPSLDLN